MSASSRSSAQISTSRSIRSTSGSASSGALTWWNAAQTRESGSSAAACCAALPSATGSAYGPCLSKPSGLTQSTTILPASGPAQRGDGGRVPVPRHRDDHHVAAPGHLVVVGAGRRRPRPACRAARRSPAAASRGPLGGAGPDQHPLAGPGEPVGQAPPLRRRCRRGCRRSARTRRAGCSRRMPYRHPRKRPRMARSHPPVTPPAHGTHAAAHGTVTPPRRSHPPRKRGGFRRAGSCGRPVGGDQAHGDPLAQRQARPVAAGPHRRIVERDRAAGARPASLTVRGASTSSTAASNFSPTRCSSSTASARSIAPRVGGARRPVGRGHHLRQPGQRGRGPTPAPPARRAGPGRPRWRTGRPAAAAARSRARTAAATPPCSGCSGSRAVERRVRRHRASVRPPGRRRRRARGCDRVQPGEHLARPRPRPASATPSAGGGRAQPGHRLRLRRAAWCAAARRRRRA